MCIPAWQKQRPIFYRKGYESVYIKRVLEEIKSPE